MSLNDKIKKQIGIIEGHWKIFAATLSALALVVDCIFKMGAFIYMKGLYDFWGVPSEYIEVNYDHILYRFFGSLAVCTVIIGISNIYCYILYKIVYNSRNRMIKKIGQCLLGMVTIPFLVAGLFFIYLFCQFSIKEILESVQEQPLEFAISVIPISIVLIGFIAFMWAFWKDTKGKSSNNAVEESIPESDKLKKKWKIIIVTGIILIIVVCVIAEMQMIYRQQKTSANEAKELHIATIKANNYIVVGHYNDFLILVPCTEEGDDLVIENGRYMFGNLEEAEIRKKAISKNVEEYFLTE